VVSPAARPTRQADVIEAAGPHALTASFFRLYLVSDRLLVFALPMICVAVAEGIAHVAIRCRARPVARVVGGALVLPSLA